MSIFNSVRVKKPKLTTFDLSNKYVGNVGFGALIPFMSYEMNPGEKFKFSSEVLIESFPMLASIYGDIDVKLEYFFVPNRLLWSKWEEFITGGEDGLFSSRPPIFTDGNLNSVIDAQSVKSKLWDYLGLPLNPVDADPLKFFYDDKNPITLFPFNAYRRIWNEWYRNENIQDELSYFDTDIDVSDTQAFDDVNTLLYRNWRKDYFTSSLPWVQRGVAPIVQVDGQSVALSDVTLNIVDGEGIQIPSSSYSTANYTSPAGLSNLVYYDSKEKAFCLLSTSLSNPAGLKAMNRTPAYFVNDEIAAKLEEGYYFVDSENYDDGFSVAKAKISSTSSDVNIDGLSFDINELRRTNAVQRWLERNARAGGRYIEQIASHFGVVVPDFRLQRSEFIGGITQPVRIGQVLQTDTPADEPTLTDALGTPSGQASSGLFSGKRYYKAFEHGWLIGLMSIVPRAEYYQGTPKKFTRIDRFDYYFPEFAHLGEEVVKKSEIYTYPWSSEGIDDTFGYQSIYSSYKWERNYVVGDFRDSLRYWTLSRSFNVQDSNARTFGLNEDFVTLGSPSNDTLRNVFSVPSNPRPFRFYVKNHVKAKRPMPKYSTPRL
nr:MAG: major capsid protein [Microvirus sp.]